RRRSGEPSPAPPWGPPSGRHPRPHPHRLLVPCGCRRDHVFPRPGLFGTPPPNPAAPPTSLQAAQEPVVHGGVAHGVAAGTIPAGITGGTFPGRTFRRGLPRRRRRG